MKTRVSPEQILAAKHEKWRRGDLTWKLHAAQKVVNNNFNASSFKLYVANIARQFGKSYWAVTKALEKAIKKKKAQIRYGAAFQTDLEEFIIPAFLKVLEDCPDDVKPTFLKSEGAFVFPNGSRIVLVGCDKNPDGLRGNTLDLVILDECGFMTKLRYIYESILIPAMLHRKDGKIIMISTPPATPAHPFVDYCLKAEQDGCYSIFTIYDNPLIDEGQIQQIKETVSETAFRREFLCEFILDEDLVLIPEWKDDFIQEVEKDQYYELYDKYVGMDIGVKDFTACIFGYWHFKKAALILEDEFMLKGNTLTTERLAHKIKEQEKMLWGDKQVYRRVSDNNNLILLQDFQTLHNLNFIPTNKDTLEAMLNELRIMVQSGKIIVHPRCKQIIGCLKYGVWDLKKKQFARTEAYGHFDALAALIYLVRNLHKGRNPIPNDFGYDPTKTWLHNVRQQTNEHNKYKKLGESLFPGIKKKN